MLFLAALGKDEVLAYVLAELFERQLSLNGLLILSRPIHLARRALLTTQSYQIVLAHSNTFIFSPARGSHLSDSNRGPSLYKSVALTS